MGWCRYRLLLYGGPWFVYWRWLFFSGCALWWYRTGGLFVNGKPMWNPLNLITYLPVIDIPLYRGGPFAVRGASYKGLSFLVAVLVAGFLLAIYLLKAWYAKHPVLGKIAFVFIGWWVLRQVVHFFMALGEDPLTKTAPYKRD